MSKVMIVPIRPEHSWESMLFGSGREGGNTSAAHVDPAADCGPLKQPTKEEELEMSEPKYLVVKHSELKFKCIRGPFAVGNELDEARWKIGRDFQATEFNIEILTEAELGKDREVGQARV